VANTPLRAESAPANPIARRDILAAALGVGAFALPAAALAVTSAPPTASSWEDSVIASRRIDAEFWRVYDRQKSIYRHWMAAYERLKDHPSCDAVTDHWCNRHAESELLVMSARVTTLPALYAKLEAGRVNEMDWASPMANGFSPSDYVMFDLERMIMREYRA